MLHGWVFSMHTRPSTLNSINYSTSRTGISEWHFYETWLLLKHNRMHINYKCSLEGIQNVCAPAREPFIRGERSVALQPALPRCRAAFLCCRGSALFSHGLALPGRVRSAQSSRARGSPCVTQPRLGSCSPAWGQSWAAGEKKAGRRLFSVNNKPTLTKRLTLPNQLEQGRDGMRHDVC